MPRGFVKCKSHDFQFFHSSERHGPRMIATCEPQTRGLADFKTDLHHAAARSRFKRSVRGTPNLHGQWARGGIVLCGLGKNIQATREPMFLSATDIVRNPTSRGGRQQYCCRLLNPRSGSKSAFRPARQSKSKHKDYATLCFILS